MQAAYLSSRQSVCSLARPSVERRGGVRLPPGSPLSPGVLPAQPLASNCVVSELYCPSLSSDISPPLPRSLAQGGRERQAAESSGISPRGPW